MITDKGLSGSDNDLSLTVKVLAKDDEPHPALVPSTSKLKTPEILENITLSPGSFRSIPAQLFSSIISMLTPAGNLYKVLTGGVGVGVPASGVGPVQTVSSR